MNDVLVHNGFDQQIAELESVANIDCAHERFVYDAGFLNGRQSILEDMTAEFEKRLESAKLAAEVYLIVAKRQISEFDSFNSLRVGFNQTMGGLGILAIIPASDEIHLKQLRKISRSVERFFAERHNVDISICNLASDKLDAERIASDFPIFRVPGDGR